jgi:hypothetical protein
VTLCFLVTRTRGDLRYTLNMLFWKWAQTTTHSICVVLSKVDRGVPLVEHEPLTFPWPFWVGFVLYFIGFLCSILSTIIYHFSFCHCIDIHITASDNPFSIFKRFSVKQQQYKQSHKVLHHISNVIVSVLATSAVDCGVAKPKTISLVFSAASQISLHD